jgi:hypothetical protein
LQVRILLGSPAFSMQCCNLALKFGVPMGDNENPLISAFPD